MISVIIPTYNRQETLGRSLRSLLGQTYLDWEAIVVDDASTDLTEHFIKNQFSDDRIKYFKLNKNSGVHVARNFGLERISGEYITFLDSDDIFFPEALERGIEIFNKYPDAGIILAPLITNYGELTGLNYDNETEVNFINILCERRNRRNKAGFSLIKKEVIGTNKFLHKNLDSIFFMNIMRKTKIYFTPDPLGKYFLNQEKDSLTSARKAPNKILSIERAPILAQFIKDFDEDFQKNCPSCLSNYAYGGAVGFLLKGEISKARFYAKLATNNNKKNIKYKKFYIFTLLPFSSLLLRFAFCVTGLIKKIK